MSTSTASGGQDGDKSGFSPSFGAGINFALSNEASLLIEWERHDFRFASGGRDSVDMASFGVKCHF